MPATELMVNKSPNTNIPLLPRLKDEIHFSHLFYQLQKRQIWFLNSILPLQTSLNDGGPTERQRIEAHAWDKLCLSSVLQLIQIFNTALQDLKKICRIRGCKPGQLDILIHLALRAAFNFPTIRCTWRLIWCCVNLLFVVVENEISLSFGVPLQT